MLAKFFAPLTVKIGAAVILALVAAVTVQTMRANSLADARDEALREAGAAETRHAVTRASLEALIAEMDAMVREGAVRRERAQEAMRETRDAGRDMREAAENTGRTDWRGVEGL